MTLRRPTLILALLAAAACGESTGPLDNVASVTVTPSSPSIDVGLTVQFQAQALDANNQPIANVDFTWQSSSTGVATIDQNGLATALTVGTTAITASAGSAPPGSQPLLVEASQCTDRIDVVLDAGQHQAYDGDQCLFLPTGAVGDRYRVAVIRPTVIEDAADVPDVWLEINPILVAQQAEGPEPVVQPEPAVVWTEQPALAQPSALIDGTPFVRDRGVMQRTRRFHLELRRREMALGLRTAALLPSRPALTDGPSLVDPPDRADLFLVLQCDEAVTPSPVLLVNFNDDIVIYQDSVESEENPLSEEATNQMLDYFDQYVRDLVEDYWGPTPDIDGNARVIITTTDQLPDSAAAGVFSGDFRSTADCPNSNEGEVMYFDTEVINALVGGEEDLSYIALSIMAHEMKHVTSLFHGVARGAFHSLWIEEGTAEISQTMSSRVAWAAVGGPAVGDVIGGDEVIDWYNTNGEEIGPEAWGVVSQIADLIVQLSTQPNSLVTNPEGAAEFHTFYAAGWHWHRFIGDAFGGASTPFADGPLFVEMTDSLTPAGTGALAQATGRSFGELFEDLVVAMSFHTVGPEPTLAFTTWDLISAGAIFMGPPEVAPPACYPWPVTASATRGTPNQCSNPSRSFSAGVYSCPPQVVGEEYQPAPAGARCPMGPSGIRFHDFVSGGAGAGAQVQVFGAANGQLIVARLR